MFKLPARKKFNRQEIFLSPMVDGASQLFERIESTETLPYYDGLYSLIHPTSNHGAFFVFTDETIKPGYFSGDKFRTLDLTDGKRKMVISLTGSVYHFLLDDVHRIIRSLRNEYQDLEIIVDVSAVYKEIQQQAYDFLYFFLATLNDKGIRHRVVNFGHHDIIYIDNFFVIAYNHSTIETATDVYEWFLPYIDTVGVEPYRKVFISRKKVRDKHKSKAAEHHVYNDPETGEERHLMSERIDKEEELEDMFLEMGFEVVYPEDFENFREQISFFHTVKTVASLTSGGLSNALFMQPYGNLIEITTPLIVNPISTGGVKNPLNAEVHNYYKGIALAKNHAYLSVPNKYRSIGDLKYFFNQKPEVANIVKDIM